jgi:hypothetical protein
MRATHLTLGLLVAMSGCGSLPRSVLREYQERQWYTCCNIRFQPNPYGPAIFSDANYSTGLLMLPLGTPVRVQASGHNAVTFTAGGTESLVLLHEYGKDEESFRQYLDKVLISTDPTTRLATFPASVQRAIRDGRVERGMTREQVILSVGYPPTHRTPSMNTDQWTYWNSRFHTYRVVFDEAGKVVNIIGTAPTQNQAVETAVSKP